MAVTKEQICNIGLGWIGANRVADIGAGAASIEELLCKDQFEISVRATLEHKAWLFATAVVSCGTGVAVADGEHEDFSGKFTIPTNDNVVHVVQADDGSGKYDVDFEQRGGYVYADLDPTATLYIRAVKYDADPATWTPTFQRAVAARVAADLAMTLTESVVHEQRMEKKFAEEVKKGGVWDAMRGTSQTFKSNVLPAWARR
jgi:hypothetical protein